MMRAPRRRALDGPVKFWVQESWKAGAGWCQILEAGKLGDAPENLNF